MRARTQPPAVGDHLSSKPARCNQPSHPPAVRRSRPFLRRALRGQIPPPLCVRYDCPRLRATILKDQSNESNDAFVRELHTPAVSSAPKSASCSSTYRPSATVVLRFLDSSRSQTFRTCILEPLRSPPVGRHATTPVPVSVNVSFPVIGHGNSLVRQNRPTRRWRFHVKSGRFGAAIGARLRANSLFLSLFAGKRV